MAGYLAAALPPCPAPGVSGAPHPGPEAAHAAAPDSHTGHGPHAGHGAHAHHAAPEAAAAEATQEPDVSVGAPCPCGCQKPGTSGTSASRLGPVLLSAPLACALPRAAAPDLAALASLPDAPAGALDPVPRLA
jgi:hypothetical protein